MAKFLSYLHEFILSHKELKRLRAELQAAKSNEAATHAANCRLTKQIITLERQRNDY